MNESSFMRKMDSTSDLLNNTNPVFQTDFFLIEKVSERIAVYVLHDDADLLRLIGYQVMN